jgi:hypothetical protein
VKRKLYLALAAIALGGLTATTVASAAPAGRPTSHARLWEDPGLTVICGVENTALSKTKVLCQGTGVPRPPHSSPNGGDPAVTLASTGKPHLVLISQNPYVPGAPAVTLGAGRTWSLRGVTCTTSAHALTCKNPKKHGFTLRNHHYRAF